MQNKILKFFFIIILNLHYFIPFVKCLTNLFQRRGNIII